MPAALARRCAAVAAACSFLFLVAEIARPTTGRAAANDAAHVTMFRGDARHSGVSSAAMGEAFGGQRWRVQTGGPVRSTAAVVGGVVYVGSGDGCMYALDARTGERQWRFDAGSPIHSSPAVANGHVFFEAFDGSIVSVDASSGTLAWRVHTGPDLPLAWGHESGDLYASSPAIAGNALVIGAGDGKVRAIELATGTVRWTFATEGRVRSSPAVDNGVVYVGSMDGSLYALALNDGSLKWRFDTHGRGLDSGHFGYDRRTIQSSPAITGNLVVFGSRDGFLYAVDRSSGKQRWRFDHQISWVNVSPAVHQGAIYCGTSDGRFFQRVDAATGKETWRDRVTNISFASPAVAGASVYAVDASGTLTVRDTKTGKPRWRWSADGNIWSSPVLADSTVYVGADDGAIYALRTTRGPGLQRAVYWDSTLAEQASVFGSDRVKTFFAARGYAVLDSTAFTRFLRDREADRAPSVVVCAIDALPASVAPAAADTVLFRRYLDRGGKIVWLGAPPLMQPSFGMDADSLPVVSFPWNAPRSLLGVDTGVGIFHPRYRVTPTRDGERWGLNGWWLATWSADPATVTTTLARDETGRASSWVRRYGGPPGSGFVRLYGGAALESGSPPLDMRSIQSVAEYWPG